MVNINEKDADWICNVIRADCNACSEGYRALIEERTEEFQLLKETAKKTGADKESIIAKSLDECEKGLVDFKKDLEQKYFKRMSNYNKIIELLTCGSYQ